MIIRANNLIDYFEKALEDLRCHRDTKSYILGIYDSYKIADNDLSKNSITLLYASAREKQDFEAFQKIADYLFIAKTMFPQSLRNASEDYYANIARVSYYTCFRMVNKSWPVYENLADDFIPITKKVKSVLIAQ